MSMTANFVTCPAGLAKGAQAQSGQVEFDPLWEDQHLLATGRTAVILL